jgi:hypothetical protein
MTMKKLQQIVLVGALLMSGSLWAEGGGDTVFNKVQTLNAQAEVILQQAETGPADQRMARMKEHMAMLDNIMTTLHDQHPDPSMTPEQHLAWMEQHDKLVDEVLGQMQREHKLMTQQCQH